MVTRLLEEGRIVQNLLKSLFILITLVTGRISSRFVIMHLYLDHVMHQVINLSGVSNGDGIIWLVRSGCNQYTFTVSCLGH